MMTKSYKNLKFLKNLFYQKLPSIPGRTCSKSKRYISSLFSFFVGNFCSPGSGSGRPKSMRIQADPDPQLTWRNCPVPGSLTGSQTRMLSRPWTTAGVGGTSRGDKKSIAIAITRSVDSIDLAIHNSPLAVHPPTQYLALPAV
jgi:hypothetical protein